MRYLAYTIGDDTQQLPSPTAEEYAEMGRFMAEATSAGVLLATGALTPTTQGFTVRLRDDGTFSVTDGPYAEGKELIGGWALLEAASNEEVTHWSKRFLGLVGSGESRIRQLY